jgi:hypothetical protein
MQPLLQIFPTVPRWAKINSTPNSLGTIAPNKIEISVAETYSVWLHFEPMHNFSLFILIYLLSAVWLLFLLFRAKF